MSTHTIEDGPYAAQAYTFATTTALDAADPPPGYYLCLDLTLPTCLHSGLVSGKATVYQYHLLRPSDNGVARYHRTNGTTTWVYNG